MVVRDRCFTALHSNSTYTVLYTIYNTVLHAVIQASFSLVHSYADQLTQSPRFKFYKLKPDKVYYVGGFGVLSKWLPISEYQTAKPDILADEAARIAAKVCSVLILLQNSLLNVKWSFILYSVQFSAEYVIAFITVVLVRLIVLNCRCA